MFRDCSEDTPMQSWDKWPVEQSPAGATQRPWVGQPGERPADNKTAEAAESGIGDLYDPCRWGLAAEAVATVGARLYEFWLRFRDCFTTRTRDTSANAYNSLRGQLTMDNERNFANMARNMTGDDGQALQHCMSNSPWAGQAVCGQMQAESKATAALAQGSTLMLDESADEKAGTHNAGASRQDKGRMGTVETKIALGWKMVKRVKAHGVPFDLLACDALDGRDSQCRADWDTAGGLYAAQVPADTNVSVSEPHVGVPEKRGKRGRPRPRLHVLSRQRPHEVRALARDPQTVWPQVVGRHPARGRWAADFAVQRVWTVAVGQRPRAEWLVIRRAAAGDCS